MYGFRAIGLLNNSTAVQVRHWSELVLKSLEARIGGSLPSDESSLISAIRDVLPGRPTEDFINALRWFCLLPSARPQKTSALPPVPGHQTTPLDAFALLLADRLCYQPGERDMVVLSHEIVARSPESSKDEVHMSSLIAVGDSKASAMARCVGLPVALAALYVLDGGVKLRGVHGPTDRQVYEHMLPWLEEAGLGMRESVGTTARVGQALQQWYSS